MSENIQSEESDIPTEEGEGIEIDLKEMRKNQWRQVIEADLQKLIIEAAKLRKCINEAKTKTKKDFYTKKFNKVSAYVRQYVAALQRLGAPVLPEGTDNEYNTGTPTE